MLARAYELSQVPLMLRYARQKRNLLDAIRHYLTVRESKGLTALLDGVLMPKEQHGVAKHYFAAHWDFRYGSRAVSMFEQAPHARLLVLGAAASAPAEKVALREYVRVEMTSASHGHVDLASAIDELTMATEWMSAYLDHVSSALEPKLTAAVSSGTLSSADCSAAVAAMKAQVDEYRKAKPGTRLLLYAYRHVAAVDLERYRAALETDEGKWFMRTSRHALIEALKPSAERFARNLGKVL